MGPQSHLEVVLVAGHDAGSVQQGLEQDAASGTLKDTCAHSSHRQQSLSSVWNSRVVVVCATVCVIR